MPFDIAKALRNNKAVKSVTRYNANPAPLNQEELGSFVVDELNRLGDIIFNQAVMHMERTYVEPGKDSAGNANGKRKPRVGDIRYADGTKWNPGGSGEGIYFYNGSGVWTKL